MSNLTKAFRSLPRRSINAACAHFTLLVRLGSTNAIDRLARQRCAYSIRPSSAQHKLAAPGARPYAGIPSRATRLLDQGLIALLRRSPAPFAAGSWRPEARQGRALQVCRGLHRVCFAGIRPRRACPGPSGLPSKHPTRPFPTPPTQHLNEPMLSCMLAPARRRRLPQRDFFRQYERLPADARVPQGQVCGARTTQPVPTRILRAPIHQPDCVQIANSTTVIARCTPNDFNPETRFVNNPPVTG